MKSNFWETVFAYKHVYIQKLWWRWCWTIFMQIYFFSYRLHSHNIQYFVMTVNDF